MEGCMEEGIDGGIYEGTYGGIDRGTEGEPAWGRMELNNSDRTSYCSNDPLG
jgi:hypothetical protein